MGALEELERDLQAAADPKKALVMQRFFKTGRGRYGEGDVFTGLTVSRSRLIAKKYSGLPLLQDIKNLLHSEVHEERPVALLILVQRFRQDPEGIAKFYLDNLAWVNNWDLVDLTAPCILGAYLKGRPVAFVPACKIRRVVGKEDCRRCHAPFHTQGRFL